MADNASQDPPILNYEAGHKRHAAGWLVIGLAAGIGLLVLLALFASTPSLNRPRGTPNWVRCASNLRQIGIAACLYANEHGDQFPDSFETILLHEDVTADVFVCPSGSDVVATGQTLQDIVADFRKPGHVSFVYLGSGLTSTTVKPETVIAYEPLSDHGDGSNILFGDSHVEFLSSARAKARFPQLFAQNLPHSPATAP